MGTGALFPSPRAFTAALVAAGACALGACAASRPTAPLPSLSGDASEHFPAAPSILAAFDAPDPGGDWRLDDALLYGVLLETPGAPARVWYLAFEVTGPPGTPELFDSDSGSSAASRPVQIRMGRRFQHTLTRKDGRVETHRSWGIPVNVRVYDANGRLTRAAGVEAPEGFLRVGMFDACRSFADTMARAKGAGIAPEDRAEVTETLTAAMTQAVNALLAFLETFQSSATLDEVRRAIVDAVLETPGVLSFLFHLGATASLAPHLELAAAEPSSPAPIAGPAYRFPTDISINGSLALRYELVVAPPHPPFRLAAGIVAIEGSHPSDPRRRFLVRLLGARRGAPPVDSVPAPPDRPAP